MFQEIIGNDKNKAILEKAIQNHNLLHSYLFVGREGIGKKMMARQFAKKILCLKPDSDMDQKCESCTMFDGENHPDYHEIRPDGNTIKIEQIRQMNASVMEKPIISKYKIFVIDDCDKMTKEAQNCLLKTLEEPPIYVIILLICSQENQLLSTIQSRCTKLQFYPLTDEELKQYLLKQQMEPLPDHLLRLAEGSIQGLARVTQDQDILNQLVDTVEHITQMDQMEFFKKNEYLYQEKDRMNHILEYWNVLWYDQLNKQNAAEQFHTIQCIQIIEETKKRIRSNCNFDMCVDYLLFEMWEEFHEKYNRSSL